MMTDASLAEYLRPTRFLDFDHPGVQALVAETADPEAPPRERAVALYYRIRDGVRYDPYACRPDPVTVTASGVLAAGRGYCVGKAVLLAAACRAAGVPARLGFADVRNHLTSPRLRELMETDVFHYHGFTEVLLDGEWLKATPALNLGLCRKAGVRPLEWDGRSDSVFHEFDSAGRQHMEYLATHEPAADLPLERLFGAYRYFYPTLFAAAEKNGGLDGDFDAEVATGAADGAVT